MPPAPPVPEPFALPGEPYRPRRTEWLGVTEHAGWRLKLIAITAVGALPDDAEIKAALGAAEREVPQPARAGARPGVGFLIVHRGAEALWVLVCWWEGDILYERLWRADPGTTELRPVPPEGPTACVWELQAIDHERRAWIRYVLEHPAAPDLAGYLTSGPAGGEPAP
ncbi:hypothetical protein [Nonomuraea sp. KM90]|uniref:hypothetical protein n=1 Tax=Nonomuraea sp. KM90 TaxID=3457428 RepID=UPI003FCE3DFA